MTSLLFRTYLKLQEITASEKGQGLTEYALVIPFVAFGAVAGTMFLDNSIIHAFQVIRSNLANSVI